MTTPTNLPTGFDGTYKDFLKTKVDRCGANREEYTTITVAADSVTTAKTYGLVPFNKGFRLLYGATQLYTADIDTTTTAALTIDIGYAYKTGSAETDDPDAFASLLTTPRTGGLMTLDEQAGLAWVAADDGWIMFTLTGASTASGAIEGQIAGCYDGLSAVN